MQSKPPLRTPVLLAWNSSDCFESFSPEGVITTRSNRMKFRLPFYTHTSLLRTVCFVPGERNPLHFLLNLTRLIRKLSMAPSWSIITGFDCTINNKLKACHIIILIKKVKNVLLKLLCIFWWPVRQQPNSFMTINRMEFYYSDDKFLKIIYFL